MKQLHGFRDGTIESTFWRDASLVLKSVGDNVICEDPVLSIDEDFLSASRRHEFS